MSKKKILVLAENVNYNRTSSGIRSYNLLNLLATQYDVTCIHLESFDATAVWQLPEVKMQPLERKAKLNTFFTILDKIDKVRAIPTYFTGLTLWGRRLIKDWVNAVETHMETSDIALIFVLGTGHDFHAHHAVARLNTKVPIVAHIHDPYPYNQYPEPYKQTKWLYSRLASQFHKVIKAADYISFPSIYLKDWMGEFYPEIEKKHLIIPHPECIADYNDANCPAPFSEITTSEFVLMHLGSLLKERNPIHLLKAFKAFCESDPEKKAKAKLFIIGRINTEHQHLISEAWEGMQNIQTINQRLTYPESKKIMDKASGLIILEAIAKFSPFMPGKISDYIMANKPIVALTPTNSEVTRLLGTDYPYRAAVNDQEAILNILNQLWDAWKENNHLQLERPDLKNYISKEKSIQVFEKIMIS